MRATLAAKRRFGRDRLLWTGISGVAAIAGALAFWQVLEVDERHDLRRFAARSAIHARADLTSDLQSRIDAVGKLALDCTSDVRRLPPTCSGRLLAFLDEHPGSVTIEWIDESYLPRWAFSQGGLVDERASTPADALPDRALQAAVFGREGRPLIVPAGQARPPTHIRIVVPIHGVRANEGFIAEVLNPTIALAAALQDHTGLGYSIAIVDDQGKNLYTPRERASDNQPPLEEIPIHIAGARWSLRLRPEAGLLAEFRTPLREFALPLGALIGVLVTLAARAAREAQRTSLELRETHNELEQRVHDRTVELQTLSRMLMQLQDEERRRIAREIHDSTTQALTAVYLNLDRAKHLQQRGATTVLDQLIDDSLALLEGAIKETRTLAYLLHPPMIDDLGLAHALAWFVRGFVERTRIDVRLEIQDDPGRLGSDIELALFRVAQEALANIHRHSGSAVATLRLLKDNESVTLIIIDRGRGMAMLPDTAESSPLGVGIAGMRERVRQLGGDFTVDSGPQGTTVRVVLPRVESAQMARDMC
jgi:signal transduction histidine kinase